MDRYILILRSEAKINVLQLALPLCNFSSLYVLECLKLETFEFAGSNLLKGNRTVFELGNLPVSGISFIGHQLTKRRELKIHSKYSLEC